MIKNILQYWKRNHNIIKCTLIHLVPNYWNQLMFYIVLMNLSFRILNSWKHHNIIQSFASLQLNCLFNDPLNTFYYHWFTDEDEFQTDCTLGFFYMHQLTDRIAHATAFVIPVVGHWLDREIAYIKRTLHNHNLYKGCYIFETTLERGKWESQYKM